MKAKTAKETPKALDLRNDLKALLAKEIAALPELIGGLEGKDRLDAIIRLMPLVIPKAKPSHYSDGEPDDWDWR